MVIFNRNNMYAKTPTPPVNSPTPRIDALKKKGLDKSQIVARLTGTKDNSGGRSQLGAKQLQAIGFRPPKSSVNKQMAPWSSSTLLKQNNQHFNSLKPKPPKPTALGGGGGGGGNKKPTLADWLAGDETWQEQKSLFQKIREDFELSNQNQQGDVNEDFDLAMGRMGEERGRSHKNITDDFAGRGILNSGLFGKGLADYDEEYQNNVFDLSKDRSRVLEDLIESLGMFGNSLSGEEQSARQEAIRRHAEQFSVMPSAPGPAKPKPKPSKPVGNKPIKKPTVKKVAHPRIKALQKKGLDKSQIVARLTGTKDNSGGRSQLTKAQLKAIGLRK